MSLRGFLKKCWLFKIFKFIFRVPIKEELWWKSDEYQKPTFSIVMPVHGNLKLLRETLDSILLQDNNDFELIVSDDTKSKKERKIIKKWLIECHNKLNINVKYIFSKPNLGQSENTNQGLSHAMGEWIRILHSDDLLAVDTIQFESDCLKNIQVNISCIAHNIRPFIISDTIKADMNRKDRQPNWWEVDPCALINNNLHSSTAVPSGLLFRRDIMNIIGKFDPNLKRACDWDFYARLVLYSQQYGLRIIGVDMGKIFYRKHSLSNTNNFKYYLMNYEEYKIVSERVTQGMLSLSFSSAEIYFFQRSAIRYRKTRLINDYNRLGVLGKIILSKSFKNKLMTQEIDHLFYGKFNVIETSRCFLPDVIREYIWGAEGALRYDIKTMSDSLNKKIDMISEKFIDIKEQS